MSSDNLDFAVLHGTDSNWGNNALISENRNLKTRLRQAQVDLQSEQAVVVTLRKKINSLEKDRMDAMSKANEEISKLDAEVARLRSQLEKGEAVRHNLDFELAKVKREMSHEKRYANEREANLQQTIESLRTKTSDLTEQNERQNEGMEEFRKRLSDERRKLQDQLGEKEAEVNRLLSDLESVTSERDKMQQALTQTEENSQELEDKVHQLTESKRDQSDELRHLYSQHSHLQDQHEALKNDLEASTAKIHHLEENVEGERAAHLETKFNCEIIQLRIRDLESALQLEKNTKLEALTSSDKMGKQLKYCDTHHGDLQRIYQEERKSSQDTQDKLERAEREYAALSKQLNLEVEDKRKVIRELSLQMEGHQHELSDVKQELSKAKRAQTKLEESYSERLQELNVLYDNFRLDGRKTAKKNIKVKVKELDDLVDRLKDTFLSYRKKLTETETELSRLRSQFDNVSQEKKRLSEIITTKDKALRNAQTSIQEARDEMTLLQKSNQELEADLMHVQRDMDDALRQFQIEQKNNLEMSQQCSRLLTKVHEQEERLREVVVRLYDKLEPVVDQSDTLSDKTAEEMVSVTEQALQRAVGNMCWMKDKMTHLEVSLTNKQELVDQMQEAHDQQLVKLSELAEGRSIQWQQHRDQLEGHYSKLIQEIQDRHKKTQCLADQAWEKVRRTGSVQQGLERECEDLRNELARKQDQEAALLATAALLLGALLPLQARNAALTQQRNSLTAQVNRLEQLKNQVQKLSDALHLESSDVAPVTRGPTPLLRWRRAVVVVLAAHRLMNLSRGTARMISSNGLVIWTGGVESPQGFIGLGGHRSAYNQFNTQSEALAPKWLTSGDLREFIMTDMGDLASALKKNKGCTPVLQLASSSLSALLGHVSSLFPKTPTPDSGRHSLVRRLACGEPHWVPSSGQVLATLQQQVLEFTRRLHHAEVDRRDLRLQVTDDTERLVSERDLLKHQLEQSVNRGRFDQLCEELNKALQREQEAQGLLNEQNRQIEDLHIRIHAMKAFNSEKGTPQDSDVAEVKVELKKQEQRSRQLQRRLEELENERNNLMRNVKDAESALRTAARDKESLSLYIKSVLEVMNQMCQLSWTDTELDFSLLTRMEDSSQSKRGPELAALKQLVECFSQLGQCIMKRLVGLKEDFVMNQQHLNRLKDELVNRRDPERAESLIPRAESPSRPVLGQCTTSEQDFLPLHEDKDSSFSTPEVSNNQKQGGKDIKQTKGRKNTDVKRPQSDLQMTH